MCFQLEKLKVHDPEEEPEQTAKEVIYKVNIFIVTHVKRYTSY